MESDFPDVPDLNAEHHCGQCGLSSDRVDAEGCDTCQARQPAGMALLVQKGVVYGWSESNVTYERLCQATLRYLDREGVLKVHFRPALDAPGGLLSGEVEP